MLIRFSFRPSLVWLIAFAGLLIPSTTTRVREPFTLDLYQDRISLVTAEYLSASKGERFVSEYQQKHFWFYNFTIGNAKLKTFADTGSYDVLVISSYCPSKHSIDLHKKFNNTYATTRPDGTGFVIELGKEYRDIVGVPKSMLVPNQEIRVVTNRTSKPPLPPVAHSEAIMGLAQAPSSVKGHGRSWFHSLCAEGLVDECRFGLAYGTNKKGKQLLGGVDPSLYHGKLTRTKKVFAEWSPFGDVVVNNKIIAKNNLLITDSGTTTILGPSEDVRAIFKELGVKIEETNTTIRGIYPCHRNLDFGFRFPVSGEDAKTFNVLPSSMAFEHIGNGNCYAALETVSTFNYTKSWIIGQAWMQGKYVDHDITTQTMGFAHLKSLKF